MKYKQGENYKDINEMFDDILNLKTLWDKLTNKPINSAFLQNWQLRVLQNAYKNRICKSEIIKKV